MRQVTTRSRIECDLKMLWVMLRVAGAGWGGLPRVAVGAAGDVRVSEDAEVGAEPGAAPVFQT
ncbi:hypothetical protein Vgi01_08430 [Micromonospora gifhornensis]|uniref:Uncharacterized protein n=1 Tax=Micromonospora gifhornensis TaxID=84594 RepID=A0ABQ4I8E8_9ACTN|nr:hypothetical protein Vgi01_08430 [Micromonospora gifhornensis]